MQNSKLTHAPALTGTPSNLEGEFFYRVSSGDLCEVVSRLAKRRKHPQKSAELSQNLVNQSLSLRLVTTERNIELHRVADTTF